MQVRETTVDGRPTRYRVAGGGEPLVLVHGLAGSWRWWLPLVDLLRAQRRVHVVQLPRFRQHVAVTDVSGWLGRWADAAGIGRADVAGHSLGGFFAAQLAARQPRRVRRLVLVAPAGIPFGRAVRGRVLPLLDSLYQVRRRLPMVAADAVRTGAVPLAHGIAFASRCDLRDELRAVDAPTLLAWGDRDRLVPIRLAEEWQRLLPRGRVVRLRCGHVPMLEVPETLAEAMLAFLGEELADDSRDELRPREVDGVGLGRDDDEPAAR
ncbi:MAG: alpha/beta fold hydrolase [Gaiellaceae bacterium]|jgi:pimeloyl-ACP methyl ester carboxylesterase